MKNTCPECDGPAQVWADRSGGITVNFACDNPKCKSGKAPWDTPRPDIAHVRPEETMTDRPATLRQVEAANALEWAGEDRP